MALSAVLLALAVLDASRSSAQSKSARVGQLLIVRPEHPAAAEARLNLDPAENFRTATGLLDVRALLAHAALSVGFPDTLRGLEPLEAVAAVGDRGWAEGGASYGDSTRFVRVFAIRVNDDDVVIIDGGPNVVEDRDTVALPSGAIAWARVPSGAAPTTNPRQLVWVENGTRVTVTAFGFENLDEVADLTADLRDAE